MNGENIKGKLLCKHNVCKDCIIQLACNNFIEDKEYEYCVYCSVCNRIEKLGKFRYKLKEL